MRFAIAVAILTPSVCNGQAFLAVGRTGASDSSLALAISGDGATIVGRTLSFDTAWHWTAGGGLVPFDGAPAGFSLDAANDVSFNGSTIVGSMNDGSDGFAWRWTQGSGVQRVTGMGGSATFGPFVSADGNSIVGRAEASLSARRWTQATGAQPLGPVTGLPFGNGSALLATAVSADGGVIVGSAQGIYTTTPQPQTAFLPFRWTQATGSGGVLDNGQFYLPNVGPVATDVSADGSIIVGAAGLGSFLWSAQTGFQILTNDVPPPGQSTPRISGDGSTVVYKWHFWTEADGLRPLTQALTDAGCNFTGWTNLFATDVSFNGRALCGYGTNPTGQTEAWYATIPTPAATPLLAIAACLAARKRRTLTVPSTSTAGWH